MSSPNNLGGLSLISLLCLSPFQGKDASVYFCALFARGRGGSIMGTLGNASRRVTCDRVLGFTDSCEDVLIVNGFGGKAGCIGGGVTECGAVGVNMSKISALTLGIWSGVLFCLGSSSGSSSSSHG